MPEATRIALSAYRVQCAEECLLDAKACSGKGAANRSYYAVFNAVRAVLALEGTDFRKHSAVISYFRQHYVKEGIFPTRCSEIIDELLLVRHESDYGDFFLISANEVEEQIQAAEYFVLQVKTYLKDKNIL